MDLSREVARIPIIAEDMYTGYLVTRLQEPAVEPIRNNGWIKLKRNKVAPRVLNAMVFFHDLKKLELFVETLDSLNDAPFLPGADGHSMVPGHVH